MWKQTHKEEPTHVSVACNCYRATVQACFYLTLTPTAFVMVRHSTPLDPAKAVTVMQFGVQIKDKSRLQFGLKLVK